MNKKITLLSILMIVFTAGAFAQATASATASATIVTPIAITKTADMSFGNLSTDGTAGTVVLAPAGTRTTTGGLALPATTGTVTAAAFDVTGEGAYTYSITLPSTDYTITKTASTETMAINTFTSNPTSPGTLTAGAQTITVGATLNVGASQVSGTYTNATGFDVTVNYN